MRRILGHEGLGPLAATLLLVGIIAPVFTPYFVSGPNSSSPSSVYSSSDWSNWASTAWKYYQAGSTSGVNPSTGLNRDSTSWGCLSDWGLGTYIYATIYARKLNLISDGTGSGDWQFNDRINKILSFLQKRPLGTGGIPYLAYRWDQLPGTTCPDTGSQTSNVADQGRLLAALYGLKTYRSNYATSVNNIFQRSKSTYDNMGTWNLAGDYYGYYAASGFADWGYDESKAFNFLDSYAGGYVSNSLTYGQSLPAIKTLPEPLNHLILESDTLLHPLSSSVVDFAKRVYLTQSGRWSSTGKLTAWSEGSNPTYAYAYEWILVNCSGSSCNQWLITNAFGKQLPCGTSCTPLAYAKVAFSYLAIYGETPYTLALVNAAKTLASSVGFGEATTETGENAGFISGFATDLTNEYVLAAAYKVLASSPPQTCPKPGSETPKTNFFHPYTEFWFSRYDMVNAQWDAIHIVNTGTGTAAVQIAIGTVKTDSLTLGAGQATYRTYPGILGGPVHITSNQPIWVTQRILGWTAFQEIYGTPGDVPSIDIIGTWYDLSGATADDIYVINPSTSQTANVNICVAGFLRGQLTLGPGREGVTNFPGIVGGPLRILSNIPVFASQRVIGFGDFAEIIGLPNWYTFTETWFNWYDMKSASWDAIHMLNPGTSTATVNIYVNGVLQTSLTLAPGAADYRAFPGLIGGPVKVVSTAPIWVTQRIIGWGGWKEVFGVPTVLANTKWYMTWYDMQYATWDAIHVINPSAATATVSVYVGGVLRSTLTVKTGAATYVDYPGLWAGPIQITSNVPIMASQRILGWSSFEETIAAAI